MTTVEMITIFAFMAAIAAVYSAEFFILGDYIRSRINGKSARYSPLSKAGIFVHVMAVTGIGCFLYGYFVEPYNVYVSEINIQTPKLNETSFRIVQISDMHCDVREGAEESVVEIVNSLEPDVIVFTGDAINSEEAIGLFRRTMGAMEASTGKFAVRGNWDENYSEEFLYADTGFELLDNRAVSVEKGGETIYLLGVNYFEPEGTWELLQHSRESDFRIFLFHSPDLMSTISNVGVDLYLAGHTHGGQVALPLYGALVTMSRHGKKYERGLYQEDETVLYVNRGIGMEGNLPPVRFFAPPEVAVFDITPAKKP